MRIESSQISYLTAHRSASATAIINETLVGARTSDAKGVAASATGAQRTAADAVQLSPVAGSAAASDLEDLPDLDPKQTLAVLAIEALLGHRIKWFHFHPSPTAATPRSPAAAGPAVVRRTELHSESEQTSFQGQGVVETADGRSIQFAATLTMQREFQSYTATTGPKTADPLVLNFGGTAARLTAAKISFDLHSDGTPENISFVAGGSGFLVLDSNGDG
jgi:hypothetical protein